MQKQCCKRYGQTYKFNRTAGDGTRKVISTVSHLERLKAFVFSDIYINNLNSVVVFGIFLASVLISVESGTKSKGNR